MSEEQKIQEKEVSQLNTAVGKGIAQWLGIELKITLLGVTVLDWKFPPDGK